MHRLVNVFFVIVVISAATWLHWPGIARSEDAVRKIATAELKHMIDSRTEMALVNVLPKIIYDDRHIPGSINIPIGMLEKSDKLPSDKHMPVVFYCMGVL